MKLKDTGHNNYIHLAEDIIEYSKININIKMFEQREKILQQNLKIRKIFFIFRNNFGYLWNMKKAKCLNDFNSQ